MPDRTIKEAADHADFDRAYKAAANLSALEGETTDHLVEAVEAFRSWVFDRLGIHLNGTLVRGGLRAVDPIFATYYEDKGRQAAEAERDEAQYNVTRLLAAFLPLISQAERLDHAQRRATGFKVSTINFARAAFASTKGGAPDPDIAAAEDKGRSEERERLQPALRELARPERWQESDTGRVTWLHLDGKTKPWEIAVASLDTDQEAADG